MLSLYMNAVVVVSLECRAAQGTMMAVRPFPGFDSKLSRNASHRYDYSTSTVSLTVTVRSSVGA